MNSHARDTNYTCVPVQTQLPMKEDHDFTSCKDQVSRPALFIYIVPHLNDPFDRLCDFFVCCIEWPFLWTPVNTMSVTYPATLKLIEIDTKGPGDARPTALRSSKMKASMLIGKLTNKVFVVTGVSSGIGVETLRALYAIGAHVFGTVRNVPKGPSSASHGVCGPVKARRYLNNHSVILLTCTTAILCGKQMQS